MAWKPHGTANTKPDIPAAFDVLMSADGLAFGGVGIAGIVPETATAFRQISATGNAYSRHIERLFRHGTPAGRVYGATLLAAIDPARAAWVWGVLSAQPGSFEAGSGCVVDSCELSRYAANQLRELGVEHRTGRDAAEAATSDDTPPDANPTAAAPPADGAKLLQAVLTDGPMSPVLAVGIVGQVAAALDKMHADGRVHGRVATRTILVDGDDDGDGRAALIGDGVRRESLLFDTGDNPLTIDALVTLAPERLAGDGAGPSSDIYSLTCVLYECLTGEMPYQGDGFERMITAHLMQPPPRPSDAGVTGFDDVIATGMAKEPARRYRTATELARHAQAAAGLAGQQFQPQTWYPEVGTAIATQAIADGVSEQRGVVLVTARSDRHFVECVFGDLAPEAEVYVSRQVRTGGTRGPHFDLYDALLHDDFPFVATLNLAGKASVAVAVLDPALTSYYRKHYPKPSEAAHAARRMVSKLTLLQGRSRPEIGRIEPGVGMIIPQRAGARPVVHEVSPPAYQGPESYGLFLKFIVPRSDARDAAVEQGFQPWRPGAAWFDQAEVERASQPPPLD